MPEIETPPSPAIYDPWDYDEKRPKKYAPRNTTKWEKETLDQARDELFENGSVYLETQRHEIIGINNVLLEIDDVIHALAEHKAYRRHGARLEPGVIFEGDPGTGKTLVSRYIATESDALFINVRDFPHLGSLFRDADIRDLFARARRKYRETQRPVILFWDEFENGACERSGATPEQVATVSQLTAELDGVHGKNQGVLLIGCTNYIFGIDTALKRSGRMGIHIEFCPPDREGKRLLLEYYLSQRNTKGRIDVDTLSYFFDGEATAADIEEATVEAWRYAVRRTVRTYGGTSRRKPVLTQDDLVGVFLKRLVGPPTAFVNLPMEDRARIAVHEVGHAIMALVHGIPLRLITVQPGKKSLGRCITAEVQEHIGTIDEMMSQLRVGIGSIVAEQVADVPALIGSTGDVRHTNELAGKLVDNLYSGERTRLYQPLAVASIRADGRSAASPNVSALGISDSDADVRELLDNTYTAARQSMDLIGKDNIWAIANRLNEVVTLTGEQFTDLFEEICGNPAGVYRA